MVPLPDPSFPPFPSLFLSLFSESDRSTRGIKILKLYQLNRQPIIQYLCDLVNIDFFVTFGFYGFYEIKKLLRYDQETNQANKVFLKKYLTVEVTMKVVSKYACCMLVCCLIVLRVRANQTKIWLQNLNIYFK